MATILVRPTFFPSATLISRPSLRQMAISSSGSSSSFSSFPEKRNKSPILLFDVMDTIVRDPFYQDIPAFFGMPFKELLEMKHPTAWLEFEEGLIDEMDLAKKFFKDGRPLDVEGLKECMREGYSYVDGVEALLQSLKRNNYEMHAFTNYPIWYTLIEEKLKISKYLSWTFCSCKIGKRKPAVDSYLEVLHRLGVEPASCIFIDDRVVNIEAAVNVGMTGLHFKNAACLQRDLSLLGIETSSLSTN
ncbi:flavin mononucleotide hydrolase 1, chloroplatic [Magnolia sinica]|uniref:flavin mononucleotide hydrolase 1, chloroplatic n=1 Tax=Magnolia sinica TaxID=86752 RepID=UPI00265AA420|nr:flavin mononucleotide hydrolase 1, chloroplatic [Magnolia sinica]